jgi:hypothetical protein
MSMKLDRESELFLIGLGRKFLLNSLGPNHGIDGGPGTNSRRPVKKSKRKKATGPKGYKWTAQHRKNYLAAMKKKWKSKRAEEKAE